MLQIVLLAGKFLFLIVLYVFVFTVIRSATRELRAAAPAPMPRAFPAAAAAAPPLVSPAPVLPGAAPPIGAPSPLPPSFDRTTLVGIGAWSLVVERSPRLRPGHIFPLWVGHPMLAGRVPESDIYLDDTFVSSKHALFDVTSAGPQVEDLHSTNGTQVNGQDIAGRHLLHQGDLVEIGDTVFRVEARQ